MRKALIILTLLSLFTISGSASDPIFTGIVASKSFIGITSNMSSVAIYTPDADGLFRVSACIENSSHIGGANIVINWVDVFGSTQGISFSASSSGTYCNVAFVFRDKSNNPITLSTGGVAPLPGGVGPCDVYVVVERLQ